MARVLIIDGNPASADVLWAGLARVGIVGDVAGDELDAIRLAQTANPDVILLSVSDEDDRALQICAALRTTPGLQRIPLLLLSPERDDGLEERATKLHVVDGVVRTPIATPDLVRRIGELVPLDVAPSTAPVPSMNVPSSTELGEGDFEEVASATSAQPTAPATQAQSIPVRPPQRVSTTMSRVDLPEERAAEALAAVHAAMGAPGPVRSQTLQSMKAVQVARPTRAPTPPQPPSPIERTTTAARTREIGDLREQLRRGEQRLRAFAQALASVRERLAHAHDLDPAKAGASARPAAMVDVEGLTRGGDCEPLKEEMLKEIAALQSDRELALKRAADFKTRISRFESQRDEARQALANLERSTRAEHEKHEESLRHQRETSEEARTTLEAAHREAVRATDEARREAAKNLAALQFEERARQAKEQELTRSEEARGAAANAAAEARTEAEAARAEAKTAHEQRIAASEDLSTQRAARVRAEQSNVELQQKLQAVEQSLATELARREDAERRAAASERALRAAQAVGDMAQRAVEAAQRTMAESAATHRAQLEEAMQSLQKQAPNAAAKTEAEHAAAIETLRSEMASLEQTHQRAIEERQEAHARATKEAASVADERMAARERELSDQWAEQKKQSDAKWMMEMQSRVLGAIEMLETDRGEALAALRAAQATELAGKEAAWAAERHELEREVRELAIEDAKKLDQIEEAAERVTTVQNEVAKISADRERLSSELERALAALPAERARFAAAQAEWRAAREGLRREVEGVQQAMQAALTRLLRSDRPPPGEE